eukprot:COSAG01_NODE_1122_length_11627_cov_25.881725_1_plen_73_part_10
MRDPLLPPSPPVDSSTPYPGQRSCTAGFGWSLTTGRRCCKVGSTTRTPEAVLRQAAPSQATRGNTDCSASSAG